MIATIKKVNKKAVRKEKIIEAAAVLFSKQNYHQVMMEDVAKLVSIAKGTVYNYFKSKEELYFSIMRMRMENLAESLKNNIQNEKSSFSSLQSFVTELYMFMIKHQNFFLMYQKETLKAKHDLCSELLRLENVIKHLLGEIIRKGKNENIFRRIENEFAVDLILGAAYGSVNRAIENKYGKEKLITEREGTFDFILHGLLTGYENNKNLPLINKTLVITRTIEQSKESAEVFKELGANVLIFPTLDIVPPSSWKEFDNIILSKTKIDFLIFTSAHAVKMFSKRIIELNVKINYEGLKVAAVGNKTASVCGEFNIPVDIIPNKFSSEGVTDELSKYDLNKKIIFIPRSGIGREELPLELKKLGAVIKTAPVYNVSIPTEENLSNYILRLKNNRPDLFIFTSPSTFKNFLQILNITDPIKYFNGFDVAAIGPTTRSAIENKKVKVNIMPDEYTINGLANAIVKYYRL